MKINKATIIKTCLVIALFFASISMYAAADVPIRKDDDPSVPPTQQKGISDEIPVSATIDATELAVYFETSVGNALITVYDQYNQVVYQDTVDTDVTTSVFISSVNWTTGQYTLTISYDTTNLIGEFDME